MSRRSRFELIAASVAIGFGLFVLPALIYVVGLLLFGPYDENRGLGAFYIDFFADLAEPAGRAWILALGPAILMYLVRLIFLGVQRPPPAAEEDEASPPAPAPPARRRVEPRVSAD